MPSSTSGLRRPALASMLGTFALIAGACGNASDLESPTPAPELTSASASSSASSTTATSSRSEVTSSSPATQSSTTVRNEPAVAVVGEGAYCSPRGAVAAFGDGSTAYCARLEYTDASVWSYNAALAPNPAVPETAPVGPQIGDTCIGADIGRTGVDASGNAIVCDNYAWVLNVGQTPQHPWVDEQVKWAECHESEDSTACMETQQPTS